MTTLFSLFTCAIFFMALFFSVFQVKRWGRYWPLAYVIVAVLLILPLGHWLLIEFVRGYTSDLSLATVFMCCMYLWGVVRPQSNTTDVSLKWAVVIISLVLFPMSLGLTQFDPFTLGYASNPLYVYFLLSLCLVALIAWFKGLSQIAVVISLAILANGLQIYESQNLWVYLVDPIAFVMCVASLLSQGLKRVIHSFKMKGAVNV